MNVLKRRCKQLAVHQSFRLSQGKGSCRKLICLALLSPLAVVAHPEIDSESEEKKRRLKNSIVVISTRTDRNIDDVPNEVTLISKEELDQKNPTSLKDVFTHEVDLSVRESAKRYGMSGQATGRGGSEGINIRGLEGNQVLIVQDGVRIPNSFQYGPFTTGRGDYLNLSHIKTIEVLRGPASTLYGSDGLAGVLSIQTLEPADLLKDQKNQAAYLQSSYSSLNKGMKTDVGVAIREGDWEGLFLAHQSYSHEIENQGTDDSVGSLRTKPNPMDQRSQGLIAKLKFNLNTHHQFGIGYEFKKQNQQSHVLSALGMSVVPSRGRFIQVNTTDFRTDDVSDRSMWSFNHQYKNSEHDWLKRVNTQVYIQNASTEQSTKEDRLINGVNQQRTRINQYQQDIVGINTQFESHWHGIGDHRLIYGLDLSESKISAIRNGSIPNPSEVFPNRPFPTTRYQMLGGFIQDEIDFGPITLIPGLRLDQYRLTPETVSETLQSSSGHAFTPRLGLVWRAYASFSPYLQYSTGYRAPTPDQINNSFDNRQHGYMSVGNSNLRPEKAKSLEWGFRGRISKLKYSGSMYINRYEDFISQEKVAGLGTPVSPSIYQYVNLTNARIHGWDLRADWAMTNHWKVLAGVASAVGASKKNGVVSPMNSVEPMKFIAGVQYANEAWGAQLSWRHHTQKKASQVSEIRLSPTQMATQYIPPAFGVMDIALQYRPLKNIAVRANINNLFNAKYWNWSDVRGVPEQSSVLEAYTAPGRSFSLSLRMDY